MNELQALAYTALEVSVDVAGILTAITSLIVALVANRRVSHLTRSIRVQRELDRKPTL